MNTIDRNITIHKTSAPPRLYVRKQQTDLLAHNGVLGKVSRVSDEQIRVLKTLCALSAGTALAATPPQDGIAARNPDMAAENAVVDADFPSYRQTFEATFATAEEAARAECAIAPLPGGAELAFGCRWDDSSPAHLAKAAMMGRVGVKGTFYISASRTEFMESGILQKLMEGGHAIGNHTWSHPQLFELNPNAGFREIAENRIALETAIQRPVISYVSPFGWGKNPLDPEHRPALAAAVVATGHFVTQDNPGTWGDAPSATDLMPCWRFSANDAKPSRELFEAGFREMLGKARGTPDIPRFGLGTHSWCDESGNALQEELLRELCLNPDWAQLNDWDYGAYRYEAAHGGVRKVSVRGATATFEATRFLPAFTGAVLPLSLVFSGAEPVAVGTSEGDLARGERGTWALPHATEAGRLHDRIARADADGLCAAFPGLRVAVEPDEAAGRLRVRVENRTGRALRRIRAVAAFPPKWTARSAIADVDALPGGETWEASFEMGRIARPDYAFGAAYYPVSVDFAEGEGLYRVWAEKTMPRVEVPPAAPVHAARIWGPADATALEGADWAAASIAGASLPDEENWHAPEADDPDGLWCLVEKKRNAKGPANAHVRALAEDPRQGRFVVYDFDAPEAGPVRLRTSVPATRRNVALWVNGERVPYSGSAPTIEARKGRNRIVLRADMVLGGSKTDALYLAVGDKNSH